jgi:hypothetical protein
MKWLIVALVVILGVLAAIAAGVYFTETVRALPSFFPGHNAHGATTIRYKRGAAAAVAAVVLWIVAVVVANAGRRSARAATPAA